jgi:L-seryl-tRNA(Ser) seleniumtransferase
MLLAKIEMRKDPPPFNQPRGHPAAFTDPPADQRSTALRQLPSVDEIVTSPRLHTLAQRLDHAFLVDAARAVLARTRNALRTDHAAAPPFTLDSLLDAVAAKINFLLAPSLRPVINATGVILHTNLGRAPLSPAALERIQATAGGYTNLEYDLATGTRGRRDLHTAALLCLLTGAESAVIVNNNAAAVFLVLVALARGGEALVSRGELLEIGESFRIPDIMAESGAILREVGTTNRTTLADYERALCDRTRLLLRVHRSNFRITGFTAQPALAELVELGRRAGVPVFEDLGSGSLTDLSRWGVSEPLVRASVAAGLDVVSFSGDKLLGGPQVGLIVGRREPVARIRKHPLFRALRADKLTIAALQAALAAYLQSDAEAVPVLAMIRMTPQEIALRTANLLETLRPLVPEQQATFDITDGQSVIGGGSTPDQSLPTHLLQISTHGQPLAEFEARLRLPVSGVPVLARIVHDRPTARLALDLRTVFPREEPALIAALAAALVPPSRFLNR